MTTRSGPLQRHGLPTLTEVIELAPVGDAGTALPARSAKAPRHDAPPAAQAPHDAQQLVERVLGALQRDAELMLELRLREAIAPVLARLADELVLELRGRLETTLREVVTQAASQELSRCRAA